MKIVLCGPPHSGKSTFLANLKRRLPDDTQRVFRACPDGENDLSNETGDFKGDTRIKGEFSAEFVERFCRAIDNNNESKMVIVDVGGKMSDENREIISHCDAYIIVCREDAEPDEDMKAWQEFLDSIVKKGTDNEHLKQFALIDIDHVQDDEEIEEGLKCLALIDSALEGEEQIYSKDSDEVLRGRAVGLKRKTFLRQSPLLDKLGAKIIRESGYELSDSQELNLENFSGLALAAALDCLKTTQVEGVDVPKAIWQFDSISKVYDRVKSLVDETQDKSVDVKINGIRPAFILCATTKALLDNGIESISTMDAEHDEYVPIRKIEQKEGIRKADGIKYHVIESKNAIFMDLDIEGQDFTLEEYSNCVLPKLNTNKPLYISGRVTNWLMAAVATSYDSTKVCVLQPPKGFICTCSHNRDDLGKVEINVPGIDHTRFFEDKKEIEEYNNKHELKKEFVVSEGDYLLSEIDNNDEEVGGRNGDDSI